MRKEQTQLCQKTANSQKKLSIPMSVKRQRGPSSLLNIKPLAEIILLGLSCIKCNTLLLMFSIKWAYLYWLLYHVRMLNKLNCLSIFTRSVQVLLVMIKKWQTPMSFLEPGISITIAIVALCDGLQSHHIKALSWWAGFRFQLVRMNLWLKWHSVAILSADMICSLKYRRKGLNNVWHSRTMVNIKIAFWLLIHYICLSSRSQWNLQHTHVHYIASH